MSDYRYFGNVLTHYTAVQNLIEGRRCYPRFCTFQTTYKCNHRCIGCSFGGKLDNSILDEETHISLLKQLIDIGVKGFEFCGGGEPFTLPYLERLINIIIDNNCFFGTITNGSLMTNHLMELIVKHGTYIRISLETANKNQYARYKQVNEQEYNKVVKNVRHLCKLKRQIGSKIDIGLKFAVGKTLRGRDHIEQGVSLGNVLGVSNIQFKAMRHEPEELSLSEKIIEHSLIKNISKDNQINVISKTVPVLESEVPQCWLNPLHTVIDAKGDVYLCCYYYTREEDHCIGNIYEDSFRTIWERTEHWEAIKKIDRNECRKVDCKFFDHHRIIKESLLNGRCEFL